MTVLELAGTNSWDLRDHLKLLKTQPRYENLSVEQKKRSGLLDFSDGQEWISLSVASPTHLAQPKGS
jgi:hypothetical protein